MTDLLTEMLADTPAVLYPCQETSGTVLTDASGNARHGTIANGAAVDDTTDPLGPTAIGKHIRLDGTDDYLTLAPATGATPWFTPGATGFTFEAMVHARSMPNWARLFDFSNAVSSDDMYFTLSGGSGLRLSNQATGANLTQWQLGFWRHVVLTVTAAGSATLYVDNRVIGTVTVGALVDRARANMFVGRSAYAVDPYAPMSLAYVAVYNSVLSAARVKAHYAATASGITDPRSIPGLKLWLSADAISGQADGATLTSIPDQSDVGTLATPGAGYTYKTTGGPSGGSGSRIAMAGSSAITLPDGLMTGSAAGEMFASVQVTSNISQGLWKMSPGGGLGNHYVYSGGGWYETWGTNGRAQVNAQGTTWDDLWHRLNLWSAANDFAAFSEDDLTWFKGSLGAVAWNTGSTTLMELSTGTTFPTGSIAYVLIYGRKLTDRERSDVKAWLAANPSGGMRAAPTVVPATPVITEALAFTDTIKVTYTRPVDVDSFEYRVNGGTPVSNALSQTLTLTGLTVDTDYTVEVRALNIIGAGPWRTVALRTATTYLYDDFARAASTTLPGTPTYGGPYTVRSGVAGVSTDGMGYNPTSAETVVTVPGASDVDITMTIGSVTNVGAVVRFKDTSNYWLFQVDASGASIYRKQANTFGMVGLFTCTWVIGDVLRAVALGKYLSIYRNGVRLFTVEDTAYDPAVTDLGFRESSSVQKVDLIVARVAQPGPATVAGAVETYDPIAVDPPDPFVYKGRDTKLADTGSVA